MTQLGLAKNRALQVQRHGTDPNHGQKMKYAARLSACVGGGALIEQTPGGTPTERSRVNKPETGAAVAEQQLSAEHQKYDAITCAEHL